MLTFHRLTSHPKLYFGVNFVAATMVLIGLTHSFNFASALIQLFWIVISATVIVLRIRQSGMSKSNSAGVEWA
jgi:hypothetical protein